MVNAKGGGRNKDLAGPTGLMKKKSFPRAKKAAGSNGGLRWNITEKQLSLNN